MVVANEFIVRLGGKNTISRGILIVTVAFMAYLMNAYMSYALNDDLMAVAVVPSMMGITVAFCYDVISSQLGPRPAVLA
jgi:hypothetical protein